MSDISDIEQEARTLLKADEFLRIGLGLYVELSWSEEDIIDRIRELYEEAQA